MIGSYVGYLGAWTFGGGDRASSEHGASPLMDRPCMADVAILALGERCIIRESPKAVARPRAISVRAQRAYKK